MTVAITLALTQDTVDALAAIGQPADVLLTLADDVARGVHRPTSQERRIVETLFGTHFLENIEQHPVLRWRQRHKKPGAK